MPNNTEFIHACACEVTYGYIYGRCIYCDGSKDRDGQEQNIPLKPFWSQK
jgi:hypothetical protein